MFSFSKALWAAIAVAALIAPSAAMAQVESTPVPLSAKPDFAPLQFLVGTWSCSTKSSRRPTAYSSTSTFAMDPSGWWLNERTVTPGPRWFPHAATTYDKFTYDSGSKRWADVTYGDLGEYGLATSPGMNGNTMVWHDQGFAPGNGISAQSDTTITKVSPTKATATSWFRENSGRRVNVTMSCTKRA